MNGTIVASYARVLFPLPLQGGNNIERATATQGGGEYALPWAMILQAYSLFLLYRPFRQKGIPFEQWRDHPTTRVAGRRG